MTRTKSNQGFAALEAILIIIIAALIGGVGYYVYTATNKTSQTLDEATLSSQSNSKVTQKNKTTVDVEKALLYKDERGTAYRVLLLAMTDAQKAQATALDQGCAQDQPEGMNLVAYTGTEHVFDGKDPNHNYVAEGDFARMNASCWDTNNKSDQFDGAAMHYFQKKSGKWVVVETSQQTVTCENWDHTGVPASIVDDCWDTSTNQLRAPLE